MKNVMSTSCDAAAAALFSELVPRLETIMERQTVVLERQTVVLERQEHTLEQIQLRAELAEQRALMGSVRAFPICTLPDRSLTRMRVRISASGLPSLQTLFVHIPAAMLGYVPEDDFGAFCQVLFDRLWSESDDSCSPTDGSPTPVRGLPYGKECSVELFYIDRTVGFKFTFDAVHTSAGARSSVWWDEVLGLIEGRLGPLRSDLPWNVIVLS